MAKSTYRLSQGGRIDRSKPVTFYFNGRAYQGYQGDTLASALIGNGVHLVGRSFKYHRPRGIYTAGSEEPNALVQLGNDPAQTDPNRRATEIEIFEGLTAHSQNCWPSVKFDVGAFADKLSPLLSAGFYYKTFMYSPKWWHFIEKYIRRSAGMGVSPKGEDQERYDRQYAHTDLLIIGGGVAGLTAALEAAPSGAKIMLVDEQMEPGGFLLGENDENRINDQHCHDWVETAVNTLKQYDNVTLMPRTTAFGYYHEDFVNLLERVSEHIPFDEKPEGLPRYKFWQLRAQRIILASGAIERPLIFAGNDRPGVMLANSARTYVNRYGVLPGKEAIVVTNNDSAYQAAYDLANKGVPVKAIVDTRRQPDNELLGPLKEKGVELYLSYSVTQTKGKKHVKTATIAPLNEHKDGVAGKFEELSCDLLLHSGGWTPALHLYAQHLGKVQWDDDGHSIAPEQNWQPITPVGSAAGYKTVYSVIRSAKAETHQALQALDYQTEDTSGEPDVKFAELSGFENFWQLPSTESLTKTKAFVDIQNDVAVKDIHLAVAEGYEASEHVKRYTTTAMGTDQGKTSGINALDVIADAKNVDRLDLQPTTYRPPYKPVPFGAIAGRHRSARFFDPNRITPMHQWHIDRGAVFENVGQWWRPRYYPQGDEDMEAAVQRECCAARNKAAVLDATTLGKIDIQGPDADEFLNRVYTNGWKKLKVGRCRYGVMMGEDGMVMDDGVTGRLAEDHYQMSTTTGGAAKVFGWLERWLQTEWPDLRVFLTSVTEQWAVISLCGPNSYDIVNQLVEDIDPDPEKFTFMEVRDCYMKINDTDSIPARIFRISFTGETTYEINVPASYGMAMWQQVFKAGEPYGLTPYGTEGMHLLRAEKGFILVGQETDGTVTPIDLDLDWIVRPQKGDFLGKRSLYQTDLQREDRKQLVGLYTDDPNEVLEEGRHVIETADIPKPPVPMLGHVSSSYYSPNLDRSIAYAIIKGGKQRHGEKLYVVYPETGKTVPVTVTAKEFM